MAPFSTKKHQKGTPSASPQMNEWDGPARPVMTLEVGGGGARDGLEGLARRPYVNPRACTVSNGPLAFYATYFLVNKSRKKRWIAVKHYPSFGQFYSFPEKFVTHPNDLC